MMIARSYWRSIKSGRRTIKNVPEEFIRYIKDFAEKEFKDGIITEEEYQNFIGKSLNA